MEQIEKNNLKLIIGKDGFIAQELVRELESRKLPFLCTSRREVGENILPFDLQNMEDSFFTVIPKNSIVYLLAAISSPDLCERNYEYARKINVDATCSFIERCLKKDLRVCFASTDAIFGRNRGTSIDDTEPLPAGYYALMKAEVEKVFNLERNFKAVRFSYVLSHNDKFTEYLKKCVKEDKVAELYDPFIRSVVCLQDVITALINLDDKWYVVPSKINFAGPYPVCREQIALAFQRNYDSRLIFKTTTPPESFFETRPRQIIMESIEFTKLLGRRALNLDETYSYYSKFSAEINK